MCFKFVDFISPAPFFIFIVIFAIWRIHKQFASHNWIIGNRNWDLFNTLYFLFSFFFSLFCFVEFFVCFFSCISVSNKTITFVPKYFLWVFSYVKSALASKKGIESVWSNYFCVWWWFDWLYMKEDWKKSEEPNFQCIEFKYSRDDW